MATDSLIVDSTVYDIGVIQRAAHAFTRHYVSIERLDEKQVRVAFQPRDKAVVLNNIAAEFENALIDQAVRVQVARETASIRDLIYRQAFVEADL